MSHRYNLIKFIFIFFVVFPIFISNVHAINAINFPNNYVFLKNFGKTIIIRPSVDYGNISLFCEEHKYYYSLIFSGRPNTFFQFLLVDKKGKIIVSALEYLNDAGYTKIDIKRSSLEYPINDYRIGIIKLKFNPILKKYNRFNKKNKLSVLLKVKPIIVSEYINNTEEKILKNESIVLSNPILIFGQKKLGKIIEYNPKPNSFVLVKVFPKFYAPSYLINRTLKELKVKKYNPFELMFLHKIEYYLIPGPKKYEKILRDSKDHRAKMVIVYAPVHFYNITVETTISPKLKNPRVYHVVNGIWKDVTNTSYARRIDKNGKKLIEWLVPHTSEEVYIVGEGEGTGKANLVVERQMVGKASVNSTVSVYLTIANKGDKPAYNITLNDTIANITNWTFVYTGKGIINGNTISFKLNVLYPDEAVKFVYKIKTPPYQELDNFSWSLQYFNSTGYVFENKSLWPFTIWIYYRKAKLQFKLVPNQTLEAGKAVNMTISAKNIGDWTVPSKTKVWITLPQNFSVLNYGTSAITYETLPAAEYTENLQNTTLSFKGIDDRNVTLFFENFEWGFIWRTGTSSCYLTDTCTEGYGKFQSCDDNAGDYIFCGDDNGVNGTRGMRMVDWDTWIPTKGLSETITGLKKYDTIYLDFWNIADSLEVGEYCAVDVVNSTGSAKQVYSLPNGAPCEIATSQPTPADWVGCHHLVDLKLAGINMSQPYIQIHLGAQESSTTDYCFWDNFKIIGHKDNITREQNTTVKFYNYTFTGDLSYVKNFTVIVQVSYYNNSASKLLGNNYPDLALYVFNGLSFVHIGNFNLPNYFSTSTTTPVNFSITITDPHIIWAWKGSSDNRVIGIRGIFMDYNNSIADVINITGVWIKFQRPKPMKVAILTWQSLPVNLTAGNETNFTFETEPELPGGYLISIHANQTIEPPILIVNDEGGTNAGDGTSYPEFYDILTKLGYNVTTCTLPAGANFSCLEGYNLSVPFLLKFDAVVWTTGDLYGDTIGSGPGSPTEIMLENYIKQGGRLLLEGEDIGYDREYSDPNNFMYYVAHAKFMGDIDNTAGEYVQKTVDFWNSPLMRGIPKNITLLAGTGSPYPDNVLPANNGSAVMYWQQLSYAAYIAYNGINHGNYDNARVVYLAFSIDGFDYQYQYDIIRNAIEWLTENENLHECYSQNVFERVYGFPKLDLYRQVPLTMKSNSTAQINLTISNTGSDTAILVNLTINVTNEETTSQIQPVKFYVTNITKGPFKYVEYNQTSNVIKFIDAQIQPKEKFNITFLLHSPISPVQKNFINALVFNLSWSNEENESNISFASAENNITVTAFNRAHITFYIKPTEITTNAWTNMSLLLYSDGDTNVTEVNEVNITLPPNCYADPLKISNNGFYNQTTNTIYWYNLGNITVGTSKIIYFFINCTKDGIYSTSPYVNYADKLSIAFGNQTSTNTISFKALSLPINAIFVPDIVNPNGTTTLRVTVTNPYSNAISSIYVTPQTTNLLNWQIFPNYQYYTSLSSDSNLLSQFLTVVNSTTGKYNTTVKIDYVDPNGVYITRYVNASIEIATKPDLVIIKEMPPIIGLNKNATVRIFIYNKGNSIAKNVTFTEIIDPNFLNNGGNITSQNGKYTAQGNFVWFLGNISAGKYKEIEYTLIGSNIPNIYWMNSTVKYWNINNKVYYGSDNLTFELINNSGFEFNMNANITSIKVYRNGSIMANITVNLTVKNIGNLETKPRVLLVNDTGGTNAGSGTSAPQFYSLLTKLGFDVVNCTLPPGANFSCLEGQVLNVSYLKSFDAVVWTTGDLYGDTIGSGPGSPTEIMLENYIKQGGRLLLEGEDIGYDRWYDDPNSFMYYVAHSIFESDIDNTGSGSYTGTDLDKVASEADNPVIKDLPSVVLISDTGSPYPDSVSATNYGVNLMYWPSFSYYGLVAYNGINHGNYDNARVVYLAFSLDGMNSTNQYALVKDAMIWLIKNEYRVGIKIPSSFTVFSNGAYKSTVGNYILLSWENYGNASFEPGQEKSYVFNISTNLAGIYQLIPFINTSTIKGHLDLQYQQGLFFDAISGKAAINITNPKNGQNICQGDNVSVNGTITAVNGNIYGANAQIIVPTTVNLYSSSTQSVGNLLEGQSKDVSWIIQPLELGSVSIATYTYALSGKSDIDKITIDIIPALNITNINIIPKEVEPGDKINLINISVKNIALATHNITTYAYVVNASGSSQSFGPSKLESATNYSVVGNSTILLGFNNNSNGYLIPLVKNGTYYVIVVSQPDNLNSVEKNESFRIVWIKPIVTLENSSILPGKEDNATITIYNDYLENVTFNLTGVEIYNSQGINVTKYWNVKSYKRSSLANPLTGTILKVGLTPTSYLYALPSENYSLIFHISYLEPSGKLKTKESKAYVFLLPKENLSLKIYAPPELPLGTVKTITLFINNTGNENTTFNATIFVKNLSNCILDWNINPSKVLNYVAFHSYLNLSFNLTLPSSYPLGTYNITGEVNTSNFQYYAFALRNLTKDLNISDVYLSNYEFEPGDRIMWINSTIEDLSKYYNYSFNITASLYNASGSLQSFGPIFETKTGFVVNSSSVNIIFDNNTKGYIIPENASLTDYFIKINISWAKNVTDSYEKWFKILKCSAFSRTNTSAVLPGQSLQYDVLFNNSFSKDIYVNSTVTVFNATNVDFTAFWNVQNTTPKEFKVNASSVTWTNYTLTLTNEPYLVKAGNYTIKATLEYMDPAGFLKEKTAYSNVEVLRVLNASITPFVSDMPINLNSTFSVLINNTGNDNIINGNLSFEIINSSNVVMNWTAYPAYKLVNLSFNSAKYEYFTVFVPKTAEIGQYILKVSFNISGKLITTEKSFNVTKDISLAINNFPKELEPGDLLKNITVNVSDVNQANSYNVTVWVEIYNPSNIQQTWAPNQSDNRSLSISPGESKLIIWNNTGVGYKVPINAELGVYTIKAIAYVSPINAYRTGYSQSLKIVNVTTIAKTNPPSLGIDTEFIYNVSIKNPFSKGVLFNVTNISIWHSGINVTSEWNITEKEKTVYVPASSSNYTEFKIISPIDPKLAKPGTYMIKATLNYIDPNGNLKEKEVENAFVNITPVVLLSVNIVNPKISGRGLNATFLVNVSNYGNVNTTANLSLEIINNSWKIYPFEKSISVAIDSYNTTSFNVTIPFTANETYTAYAYANVSGLIFYGESNFTPEIPLTIPFIKGNLTEIEPFSPILFNASVDNYYQYGINASYKFMLINNKDKLVNESNGKTILKSGTTSYYIWNILENSSDVGEYLVILNLSYGLGGYITNKTSIRVATLEAKPNAWPSIINYGQASNITINLNNTHLYENLTAYISLLGIYNATGNITSFWNVSLWQTSVFVRENSTNTSSVFSVSTNEAERGEYNVSFLIKYYDSEDAKWVTKNVNVTIWLGVANMNGTIHIVGNLETGKSRRGVFEIENIGGYDIPQANVTIFFQNATSTYYWFEPYKFQLVNVSIGESINKTVYAYIPRNIEPGYYNITIYLSYLDQNNDAVTKIINQRVLISPGVFVKVLLNHTSTIFVKENATIPLTVLVENSTGSVLRSNITVLINASNGSSQIFRFYNTGNVTFNFTTSSENKEYIVSILATTDGININKRMIIDCENNASVLLVNVDVGKGGTFTSEATISSALSLFVNTTPIHYYIWDKAKNGNLTYNDIKNYDLIMFTSGDYYGGIFANSTEISALERYTEAGKPIFVSGMKIPEDMYSASSNRTLYTILKAEVPAQYPLTYVTGVLNYFIDFNYSFANTPLLSNTLYSSGFVPITNDILTPTFEWSNANESIGGKQMANWEYNGKGAVVIYNGSYRSILTTFAVKNMQNADNFITNIVNWLIYTRAGVIPTNDHDTVLPGENTTARFFVFGKEGEIMKPNINSQINATIIFPNLTRLRWNLSYCGNAYCLWFIPPVRGKYVVNVTSKVPAYNLGIGTFDIYAGYKINLSVVNSNDLLINRSVIKVYENGKILRKTNQSILLSPYWLSNKYDVVFEVPENGTLKVVIHNITISNDVNITPQIVQFYKYSNLPFGVSNITSIFAINDSLFNFTYATLYLPKNGLTADYIVHCENWSFKNAYCYKWDVLNTTLLGAKQNTTYIWFNVTHFIAFGVGTGEPIPNVTLIKIYDVTNAKNYLNDTSRLIGEGLNTTFNLTIKNWKMYRFEFYVRNDGTKNWFIGASDLVRHAYLDPLWKIENLSWIFYNISGTIYAGGNYSLGNVTWNTSLGGRLTSGDTAVFEYVINISVNKSLEKHVFFYALAGNYNAGSYDWDTLNITKVGYLSVKLNEPPTGTITYVTQNKTFLLNATITCLNGVCGYVDAYAMYNATGNVPNTGIPDSTATPFYVNTTNPYNCGFMSNGSSCHVLWFVNATGNLYSIWALSVLANATYKNVFQENKTNIAYVEITPGQILMTVDFSTINFGLLYPGDFAPAVNNSIGYYNITIEKASLPVDGLYIKGTNFTGNTPYIIPVYDLKWNTVNNSTTAKNMSYYYQPIAFNITPGTNITTYYWLKVPYGIANGSYSGTVYFLANSSI